MTFQQHFLLLRPGKVSCGQ